MKRISIFLLTCISFCSSSLLAQNELDAMRFSTQGLSGTARALGAGGAFSAVGADYSAASLNPAGLALYRKSDLMFTPSLRFNATTASYLGETTTNSRSRFGFSSIGYVYAQKVSRWNAATKSQETADHGLKSYAFTIGYSQNAAYHRTIGIAAFNEVNSITEYFAGQAQGVGVADIGGQITLPGLAWNAYAIDSSGPDGNYIGAAQGGDIDQRIDMQEAGRNNDWNIGFAGNISDLFYIGGGLGIEGLRYSYNMGLKEIDTYDIHNSWANDSTPFNNLNMTDSYDTRGSGVNLKAGVIMRPTDFLRVGVSFTSPTWYSMTDTYRTEIEGELDGDPSSYSANEPIIGVYSYKLSTPYKVTVGAMYTLKKLAFLSADFEYTDYTSARFSSDVSPNSNFYYDFQTENNNIQQYFSGAYNLRVGGELRLGPGRIRLGYANYGAILKDEYLEYVEYPTANKKSLPGNRQFFTGGLGFKQQSFYIDLAYVQEMSADRRLLYTAADPSQYSPELINTNTTSNFYMTIGFTF